MLGGAIMVIVAYTREAFRAIFGSSRYCLICCDCTPHDIATPGAAHAVDCPMYD
jgi:hypothetical protein